VLRKLKSHQFIRDSVFCQYGKELWDPLMPTSQQGSSEYDAQVKFS